MIKKKTYNVFLVYRATCVVTGKVYIGKTINGSRKNAHHRSAFKKRSFFPFHKALRQYPDDWMWEWDLIGMTTNKSELNQLESELITKHNSIVPNGYNARK